MHFSRGLRKVSLATPLLKAFSLAALLGLCGATAVASEKPERVLVAKSAAGQR